MNPVLTIYIPTYNSAHLLERMLEALLPQTEPWANEVEVIVSDNASDDNTQSLVKEFSGKYTLKYFRNDTNLGPIKNIVMGPSELARGEYVWVLGSHNLANTGAIEYLLKVLVRERERFNIFYVNFNCASYPQQWTEEATGGFRGEISYIANQETSDRVVNKWYELIKSETALCTQMYAHIVKTSVWVNYWKDKTFGEPFSDAITTYPHSVMIADTLFQEPTCYIGKPLITIFNGAQTWSDIDIRIKVYYLGLPQLIKVYKCKGLHRDQYVDAIGWNSFMINKIIKNPLTVINVNKLFLLFSLNSITLRSPFLMRFVSRNLLKSL